MNTQKIQTGTVGTKGFTLVELIVVITILVILGTIAFLNLGGMSASARDSQRTSDLNQINQQVMVQQAKSGLSYMSMVDGYASSLSNANLAGATTASGANYAAGNVNYTVLGVDSAKFKDPSSQIAYKMGATILAGSAFQLAAKLEESTTALVMGTYRARTNSAVSTTSVVGSIATIPAAGFGNFKLNDSVVGSIANSSGTVTGISADLARITLSNASMSGATTLTLAAAESAGLIAKTLDSTTAVTNGGTALPY